MATEGWTVVECYRRSEQPSLGRRYLPESGTAIVRSSIKYPNRLILLKHHFRGFNDRGDGIADLELHVFSAASRDHAIDEVVANPDNDMRHHVSEFKFFNFADEVVSSGEFHDSIISRQD